MSEEMKNKISKAAQALGRLGKGIKKTLTDEERQRRTNQIQFVNERKRNKKQNTK